MMTPTTAPMTVYVAYLEDSEGCGFVEMYVHATKAGADAAFIEMFEHEYGFDYNSDDEDEDEDEDDGDQEEGRKTLSKMTADELSDWLEEEHSRSGGVRVEKVRP